LGVGFGGSPKQKHPQNHGAWCNGNARFGEYTEEMENTKAVA